MSQSTLYILVILAVLIAGVGLWLRFDRFIYSTEDKSHSSRYRRDIPITFKRFFASLYSLLVFVFMVYGVALPFTLVLIIAVWNRDCQLTIYHKFLQYSSKFILWALPGIKYTYNNHVGETFERPAVIISNHQGHFDLMCIMMMTPKLVVLTNQRVWRNPLYGWIIRFAEFYPVTNGLDYNIPKLKSLIDRGYSVVVFPEGTRSPDCRILRFHTGAFYLAEKLGVDILPVILHGVGHCIPKEDFMLRPGHMYLEVMNRIPVNSDGSELYMRRLSKQVRAEYIVRFNTLVRERQTACYFAEYVANKYCYLKPLLNQRIYRVLRHHDYYADVIDCDYTPGRTVLVHDTVKGAFSWLFSLVHQDVTVCAVVADDADLCIALATPAIPPKLRFVKSAEGIDAGYVICMDKAGNVESVIGQS